ncbi:pkinase-domain-containing protein [Phaffia rhodozyma]|uniref:Pkinase-domain-containing protein n=1 Tax=Phaffia rhodozyma TaxID=264483 RepID=A0A0F7SV18_PHARH|nr:pkinase-domain-containing protein [Phaffia rhodozyma]
MTHTIESAHLRPSSLDSTPVQILSSAKMVRPKRASLPDSPRLVKSGMRSFSLDAPAAFNIEPYVIETPTRSLVKISKINPMSSLNQKHQDCAEVTLDVHSSLIISSMPHLAEERNRQRALANPLKRLRSSIGRPSVSSFSIRSTGGSPIRPQDPFSPKRLAIDKETNLSVSFPQIPTLSRREIVIKENKKPDVKYVLGNRIGKGQFGTVYRALNFATGETVAIKQISLDGLKEKEVDHLMEEVNIFKRLDHPAIVKYLGMVRDRTTLNIVLEYVENGSLGSTIQSFGKLDEKLVAGYVIKILEGLSYLHDQKVVHCDLKAANILTTKTGNVKLTDFGVSLCLASVEKTRRNDVAGTPNWMAPEVIEMQGTSTASDIWSLGCTIIELLTGKPPFAEIKNGLAVLYHIVEGGPPEIPEGCSTALAAFLSQCFEKDPTKRPTAKFLFNHAWLQEQVEIFESSNKDSIPFFRRLSLDVASPTKTTRWRSPSLPDLNPLNDTDQHIREPLHTLIPKDPLLAPLSSFLNRPPRYKFIKWIQRRSRRLSILSTKRPILPSRNSNISSSDALDET